MVYNTCKNLLETNNNELCNYALSSYKNKYFSPVYLLDYEDFLEYPEELVCKTEQFMNDLKNTTDFIKNKINFSFH